jgi:hypothetical protein
MTIKALVPALCDPKAHVSKPLREGRLASYQPTLALGNLMQKQSFFQGWWRMQRDCCSGRGFGTTQRQWLHCKMLKFMLHEFLAQIEEVNERGAPTL